MGLRRQLEAECRNQRQGGELLAAAVFLPSSEGCKEELNKHSAGHYCDGQHTYRGVVTFSWDAISFSGQQRRSQF